MHTCSCRSASKSAADDALLTGKLTVFKWRLTSASEEAMKAWTGTPTRQLVKVSSVAWKNQEKVWDEGRGQVLHPHALSSDIRRYLQGFE
jgi:hypothetical protein